MRAISRAIEWCLIGSFVAVGVFFAGYQIFLFHSDTLYRSW
jgi:hypothetical protein